MKKGTLITYWVTTCLVAFGMTAGGIQQILHTPTMIEMITHIGYPVYFLYIIGVWKILGAIAILVPGFKLVKEWAYAGLFFAMTGALASHLAVGDCDFKAIAGPSFQTVFICLSWYFRPADRKISHQ